MKFCLPVLLGTLCCVRAFAADGTAVLPEAAKRAVDFVTDIQPILQTHCLDCHGPDKQKGGYRVDVKTIALTGGDAHAPNVHAGNSAESPLIHFVSGLDKEMLMPAKGKPLKPEEISLLRAWIDQGAVWPDSASTVLSDPLDWWSLRPLTSPSVPPGAAHPVDAFVRKGLAGHGIAPNPAADRRTLIRRVTFDLTGLPPPPQEADAFVADESPDAWEKLVDRLLASPRYGERWARHWLDVVHYGDTHGYDKDQPRPHAWPYRDYVIRALNGDKPYGRFVREQIAGDALYPGSADGILALGFLSAGPWDFIGHVELPESRTDGKIARLLDRDDMVSNTMTTFTALTVQCARCHNHKFDPVKQEDYYNLQSVFSALDRADKTFDTDPETAMRRAALLAEQAALTALKKDLEPAASGGGRAALLEKLIDGLRQGVKAPERAEYGYHSRIENRQDTAKWVQADLGFSLALAKVMVAAANDDFAGIGAGFGFPLRYKIEISDDASFTKDVILIVDRTRADVPNPRAEPVFEDAGGKSARYIRFTATKLAERQNDFILALAELQALDAAGRNVALGARVSALDSTDAPPRWRKSNLTDGYYHGRAARTSPEEIAALEKEKTELLKAEPPDSSALRLAAVRRDLAAVDAGLAALPPVQTVYAGTVLSGSGNFAGTGGNGGKPRPVFVLRRGDVRQEGAPAAPAAVPVSHQLPSEFHLPAAAPESARRAALAGWITDPRNPLTWRVIVNRVWQYHFGRGLSDSPNDFGRMGRKPSDPELLDWLAAGFRDGGQSLKALHRLLLTSETYRQSSAGNEEAEKTDAGNTLLWRMNRRKLEAEAVRDSILDAAGQLDFKMGGPGYQDFVVEKPEHSPHYQYSLHDPEDPATHRRSIYRFIVRSQTEPLMTVLDCADPSMSVDRRNETLNALQALALRNNKLTLAMAKHFADRVTAMAPDPAGQIAAAFRLALSRDPRPEETGALTAFAKEQGMVNVCRVILNLNEFTFID
ncbi:MAG: DUF1553 domain-containing protein [Verrucomicrobiota bacterium]